MGLCLRRVVLQYPRLGWQVSTGIHGSFQSESVATFDWNRWQVSTGISGNLRPEYALLMDPATKSRIVWENVTAIPTTPLTMGLAFSSADTPALHKSTGNPSTVTF